MKTRLIKIFSCFCLICAAFQSYAQNEPFLGNAENINLPKDNLGVMSEYVLEVDDIVNGTSVHKLYVYGRQGILIYNLNISNWQENPAKIEFSSSVSNGFYDRSLVTDLVTNPAFTPMLYIHDNLVIGQLFVVGPDLRLWYIDVTNDSPHILPTHHDLLGYKLISTKLVYDSYYSRIVWLILGRQNNSSDKISCLYTVDLSTINYTIQNAICTTGIISDFAINDVVSKNIIYAGVYFENDIGYWTLLRRDNFGIIQGQQYNVAFIPGLIKYVHTTGVHQVYCLPGCNPNPSTSIYIFNGDSQTHIPFTMISPAGGYTCAEFNDVRKHLYLGAYTGPTTVDFDDVYIYQFQNNTAPPLLKCSLNTYEPPRARQNVPLAIESISEYKILVMKKHEIVILNYTGGYPCPYTSEKLLDAYGNFFRNADITDDSRVFITKFSGGFLEYDISEVPWAFTDHQTGQSVHSSFANEVSGKKYYFTKEHSANCHLFIDENTGGDLFTDYPCSNPIGDCIFNRFQNHILISDFRGIPGPSLKAYSEIAGGLNCQYSEFIGGNSTNNGNIFITQDAKLLLMSGVNNSQPKVIIKNAIAADYEDIAEIDLADHFPGSNHLNVLFGGNRTQNYFVVGDDDDPETEQSFQENLNISYFYAINSHDYLASPSIAIDHDDPRFLEVMQESEYEDITISHAFVAGTDAYFSNIIIEVQQENISLEVIKKYVSNPITALELASYYDNSGKVYKLFSTTWDALSETGSIWSYSPGSDEEPVEITQINTYISKMDYDEKTLLLYLYGIENNALKILQIDVIEQFYDESEGLSINTMPTDKLGSLLCLTNETLFDNEDHQMYIPNGEMSSISRLGFAFDRLHLKDKVSWISFPRLENNPVPAIPVLEKIRPFPSYIYMENIPLLPDDPGIRTITYQPPEWEGSIEDLQSTYGYKHSTSYTDVTYQPLLGSILDPGTSITIFRGQENWVGYFPTWPQDPFDALAPVLNKLTLIKHHDWACFKCQGMGPGEPEPTCWMCSMTTPIEYADMLILECTEDVTFQWGGEFSAVRREIAQPKHFVYGETPDYAPIFIELDTNDQPLEIGAFIGDSCIGATVFEPGDSAIMIRGYMPDDTAGIITFEKYYGSEKALPERISEYYVQNNATGIREKRTIDSREKSKYYRVSFKNEFNNTLSVNPLKMNFYPNPCQGIGTMEYFLPEESDITFEVFDVYGRKLNQKVIGIEQAGSYSISWLSLAPDESSPGIYFIRMSACGTAIITKLIITE